MILVLSYAAIDLESSDSFGPNWLYVLKAGHSASTEGAVQNCRAFMPANVTVANLAGLSLKKTIYLRTALFFGGRVKEPEGTSRA